MPPMMFNTGADPGDFMPDEPSSGAIIDMLIEDTYPNSPER